MSAAPRSRLGWLAQNYEKLLLMVVLVVLLLSAMYLVVRVGRGERSLTRDKWDESDVAPIMAQPLDREALDQQLAAVREPYQSGAFARQLMVSELRVTCVNPQCAKPIPYRAKTCPWPGCGQVQPDIGDIDRDGDGMPDEYELAHGLNPFNPEDAMQDKDGDGFSNYEEFQSGTDPSDPQEFPSVLAKLRWRRVINRPFKLRFHGVNDMPGGGRLFLLNLRTLEKSYFVKEGDEVEGYTIVKFEEKIWTNDRSQKVDESVLTLQKGTKLIPLVKNKPLTEYEWMASMVFLIDGTPYRVRVGDTIDLKGHKYKIIDIGRDGVKIRDTETDTKKDIPVGRLSDSEALQLGGGTPSSIPAPAPTPVRTPAAPLGPAGGGIPGRPDMNAEEPGGTL